ncbi:MAG: hypothetical protein HXY36_06410 [Chloroflexi bacterium]|nr:hypothetical protein [Chloroflexota bacterium]NWF78203.1 hypothetical protein [Chloroflexota bacterium]
MPKWLVRLEGEKFDLEDLPSLLCSPKHTVIEEDGLYYLESSDFDSLGSAYEVREHAIAIIKMLNGAMKLYIPSFRGVYEGGVTMIEEDGRRHHYVYLEGSIELRSKVSANLTVTTSNNTQQTDSLPSTIESWISLAKADTAVADALHFFRENTWISLYKVYEIISGDVGGQQAIIKKGWATKHSLSRFTQTAQSKAALGDLARHAANKFKPPAQPMSIQEAESLVRGIMLSWLSSKT